ncbi:FkbM family methyltransferase [Haloterrigena salina JCM 13891]|uniref:FkbM family methyltransferase n=1 Tax=Haloterrigena salina JCM 13891 TaxID=1227488 RepID=M0C0G7_9EURY|nr:FkbM family methyltransferase [Haloterrigena salina JCM 13891]
MNRLLVKSVRAIRRYTSLAYWRGRGSRTFEIEGVTATFTTEGHAARSLQIFDEGEREMVRDMVSNVDDDDVFWDIGGHLGFHSCLVGQCTDRVETFEPTSVAADRARKHAATNDVDAAVHEYALWDANETLTLEPDSVATGGEGPVTVPARKGDDLVDDELPQPNVVKIDVEGAEPRVVDGMRETLADDQCRLVYCEVHRPAETRPSVEDHGATVEEFLDSLRDLGFTVETIMDRGLDLHVKAHAV